MQERRNSIANTLELRLSCTNPSIEHDTLEALTADINTQQTHNPIMWSITLIQPQVFTVFQIKDLHLESSLK